jgi:WD40 repeat protein
VKPKSNSLWIVLLIFVIIAGTSCSVSEARNATATPWKTPIPTTYTLLPSALPTITPTILPQSITQKLTTTIKGNKIILSGFDSNNSFIRWLYWSKDGKTLFIGTDLEGVIVYDVISKKVITNFENVENGPIIQQHALTPIQDLALSPDENTLAAVIYASNSVRLINPRTGELLKIIYIDDYWPAGLSFSPNSKVLAIRNSRFNVITLWDISSGQEIKELYKYDTSMGRMSFSPDGKSFRAYVDGAFRVWDTQTWELQKTYPCKYTGVLSSFSPDGNRLALLGSGADTEDDSVWDFKNCKKLFNLSGAQSWTAAIAYEPSGKYIAAGGSAGGDTRIIHNIIIWDANTGAHVRDLAIGYSAVTSALAFNPNGTLLASGVLDEGVNEVIIWDLTQP